MPRSLRIERENGVYHIINRGNYRQDLFINEGAHASFENCLFEACEKSEWVLEGLREANRLRWEILLEKGLSSLGKDAASAATDLKSAKWKIMLAALLKQKTSATNVWITGQLRMGTPDVVGRYVSEF